MTRTNHGPDFPARELISMRLGRMAAVLVGSALVLATITLLAAPVRAERVEVPAAIHAVDQADVGRSGARQGAAVVGADRLVLEPGTSYENGRWTWRVPNVQWLVGVVFGLIIAVKLLLRVLATVPRPTLTESGTWPRWFDGRIVGSLFKDPLVWPYLIAASLLAGAFYSGAFRLLSGEPWEELGWVVRWGPVMPMLAAFGGTLLGGGAKRRKLSAGDSDALMTMVQEKSKAFLELVRGHVDEQFRREISRIAPRHEVGLIQRTMKGVCDKAVDQGRLQPTERDEFMSQLSEIQPGRDDRSTFLNRLAAVDLATKLVEIDELVNRLEEEERRKSGERRETAVGPERKKERRSGTDRRVRSVWRQPDGGLELDRAG